jgi:hypothetical protein
LHARTMRTAISPRFAMSIFLITLETLESGIAFDKNSRSA